MNAFSEYNFENLSESDIREEIIARILDRLGYRSGTLNNIIREKPLEIKYKHMSLGRKKPGKDPVLRGRPDYICEARGITRWCIEAKPPNEPISKADIEQAYSYSVHPEIKAPLFVLCNGRQFVVFRSYDGPDSEPILSLEYSQLSDEFHVLENLLSPQALNRHYPVRQVDMGKPLASGYGSAARVVRGVTRLDKVDIAFEDLPEGAELPLAGDIKKLEGHKYAIIGSECYRDPDLGIVADVEIQHPHDGLEYMSEVMGIKKRRYSARDEFISSNPEQPTIFESSHSIILPEGTQTFDMLTWSYSTMPCDVDVAWQEEAIGYLRDDCFHGIYAARMLAIYLSPLGNIRFWASMRGEFNIIFQPI